MLAAARPVARSTRRPARSPSNHHDNSATSGGSAAITTPAAEAEVRATPESMKIENRKLPKKDWANKVRQIDGPSGASSRGRFIQGIITTAAMAKRSHASRKTGNAADKGFESAV